MGQVAGGRDLLSAGLKGIAWPYFLCAFFLIADKLVMYLPPPSFVILTAVLVDSILSLLK